MWRNAWGFDWFYDRLFVRPFVWLAKVNRYDTIDRVFAVIPAGLRGLSARGDDDAERQRALVRGGRRGWTLRVDRAGCLLHERAAMSLVALIAIPFIGGFAELAERVVFRARRRAGSRCSQ